MPEVSFHTLTALHHSAAAVRCVPIGELRPLLLQAMGEQPMTTPDNYEMGADYWHGKTELQKAWTKEMHQKLPIHKGPTIALNRLMRSECDNIFEHAQKHWRRCSERSKEVFEANSDEVYEHIRLMQPQTSAYWTSINLVARALQLWFRRWAQGRWFKGNKVEGREQPPKRKDGTVFVGFDHDLHTQRTEAQPPTEAEVITASRAVVKVKLARLRELHTLRRLLNKRREIATAAVRKCWLEEFFKHMGKPGQPPDHSLCPAHAACNDPE